MKRKGIEIVKVPDLRIKDLSPNGEPGRIVCYTENAIKEIQNDLVKQVDYLKDIGKYLESKRLLERTEFDIEMMKELGYCSGIENYSRHFDGRSEGEPAFCLLDFYGKEFLLVIDESHVTLPQLHGMYKGDYSRKKSLIDYGFRLPSAFDNRPLKFEEFEKKLKDVIFVSATPGDYEKNRSKKIVEQLVRPTGLIDPVVEIRKSEGQMDDIEAIKNATEALMAASQEFGQRIYESAAQENSESQSSENDDVVDAEIVDEQ